MVYNDRSQLTSNTDSNGNAVLYEYDTVGRVSKVTPPQGANYRTQYTYKKNGSVSQVKVYDAGSAADTDYTYDTTSGGSRGLRPRFNDAGSQTLPTNNPVVSSANVRTTYGYDSAGHASMLFPGAIPGQPCDVFQQGEAMLRADWQTMSACVKWQLTQAGGTTNLYKTSYAYSYLTYGRQLIRTEQTYSGGWNDDNKVTYQWDSLERQESEVRNDWDTMLFPPAWAARYDVTQEYGKNGNRTRMHR